MLIITTTVDHASCDTSNHCVLRPNQSSVSLYTTLICKNQTKEFLFIMYVLFCYKKNSSEISFQYFRNNITIQIHKLVNQSVLMKMFKNHYFPHYKNISFLVNKHYLFFLMLSTLSNNSVYFTQ